MNSRNVMNSRKKKITIGVALALAFTLAVGVTPVFAVHRGTFELDGNIKHDGGTLSVDWADLFDVSLGVATPRLSLPSGYKAASFKRDFVPGGTSDSTTFATGSKDILNITGGWQCAIANNIGDKVDLLNAYAVAFVDNSFSPPHTVIYFGSETASNEGSRDIAFWFLKDSTVGCVAGKKATDFTGNHQNGDILITAEYTGTSGVSTIQAFEWVGGASGSLNTTPLGTGGDCRSAASTDPMCARTNDPSVGPLIASSGVPWLTQTKTSNPSQPGLTSADLDIGEFFEGGIDLTALSLTGCFTQFLADTRSSASPTATIFDYALSGFPLCGISVGKACVVGPNSPKVNPNGDTIHTVFDVPIKNTGAADVFDVTLQENNTFGTGEGCQITAINGTAITPVALPTGTPEPVVSSLAGGATADVTVECDSTSNPLVNSVTAAAKTSSTGTTADLTASHTTNSDPTKGEVCPLTLSPSLTVTKVCTGCPAVTLVSGGFQVCVTITVTNTSSEDLMNVVVRDDHIVSEPLDFPTIDANGGRLEPSATATAANTCYTTSAPNDPVGVTDPRLARFKDQLTAATARGAISGKTIDLSKLGPLPSTSCPLCPTCP